MRYFVWGSHADDDIEASPSLRHAPLVHENEDEGPENGLGLQATHAQIICGTPADDRFHYAQADHRFQETMYQRVTASSHLFNNVNFLMHVPIASRIIWLAILSPCAHIAEALVHRCEDHQAEASLDRVPHGVAALLVA